VGKAIEVESIRAGRHRRVAAASAGWGETRLPQFVHHRISRQAMLAPTATAIAFRETRLSYAQLDAQSNQIAHHLIKLGVEPGTLIGVCARRAPETIVGTLAILKAGAAFVPLDPDYPRQRLLGMLADVNARVILTTGDRVAALPDHQGEVVLLDDPWGKFAREPTTPPSVPLGLDSLAYAVFTSGSTGRPKAALLAHRGLVHVIAAQVTGFGVTPHRRVLQFASPSFDASVSEIFVTLTAGATLVLADTSQLVAGTPLVQTLRDLRITDVTLPPSVLALLGEAELPDLRTLVVAGERCSASLASQWSKGRQLINAYGPTETTICASVYHCPRGRQAAPSIGRPLPGCEFHVLDEHQQRLPPGEAGELYIGGCVLARGYLNRPTLTAQRFIKHPFATDANQRLYRTGDLVRRCQDGNFEFLGRVDHQVKIRGIRIEPDEVAATLKRHPSVGDAVVLPWAADGTHPVLVAFVVARPGAAVSTARLHSFARASLPISMLPSEIVLLTQFPLTPNGKLDRSALLARRGQSGRRAVKDGNGRVAPRTALELELTQMCESVLQTQPVGVTDDFFQLGGDSLRATELLARIERCYGQVLPIARMLEDPTVEGLEQWIRGRSQPRQWSPIVAVQPRGTNPPLFLMHPGGGNVLCYLELARQLSPNQPVFALQAAGVDGVCPPVTCIKDMATEYVRAVRRIQETGPYALGGWSFGGIVAYEMACQLADAGESETTLLIIDSAILYSFAVVRALFTDREVPLFRMRGLDRDELLRKFRRPGIEAGLVPPGATDAQAKRIFDVFMMNVEALLNYYPQPYAGVIDLFLGRERLVSSRCEPLREWQQLCHSVDVHHTPGHHLTLLQRPHVQLLACAVSACLSQRRAPSQ